MASGLPGATQGSPGELFMQFSRAYAQSTGVPLNPATGLPDFGGQSAKSELELLREEVAQLRESSKRRAPEGTPDLEARLSLLEQKKSRKQAAAEPTPPTSSSSSSSSSSSATPPPSEQKSIRERIAPLVDYYGGIDKLPPPARRAFESELWKEAGLSFPDSPPATSEPAPPPASVEETSSLSMDPGQCRNLLLGE